MSHQNSNDEKSDNIYKDSAKGARIYELILEKINFDNIKDVQVETDELNAMNSLEALKYIDDQSKKEDQTDDKLDYFTKKYKIMLNVLISDISNDLKSPENSQITDNLLKLSAYYYIFKIKTSNNPQQAAEFTKKIDDFVNYYTTAKDDYYGTLIYLGEIEKSTDVGNKVKMIDRYFNILFFLNEPLLNEPFLKESLNEFMIHKSSSYPQYKICMPIISFRQKELKKNIKSIYNILSILERTESFKTNERFEYFQAFNKQHELLDDINYILVNQNKQPLISLDKATNDITEEAIKYSLEKTQMISNDADIISKLNKTLEDAKNNRNEYKSAYEEINKKYLLLIKEHEKLLDAHKKLDEKYDNDLNELESQISEMKNIIVERNAKINQEKQNIISLKEKLENSEIIIEKISYREIGSKIISFFSLSLPEDTIKEYESNNISPRNVNIITEHFKTNLTSYYNFLKSNGTDLKNVLKEIKTEKKSYDSLVHDREKNLERYIELMNMNDKKFGDKIKLIFNNSNLLFDYVFNKNSKINASEIRDEFKSKNEEFKKLSKGC